MTNDGIEQSLTALGVERYAWVCDSSVLRCVCVCDVMVCVCASGDGEVS